MLFLFHDSVTNDKPARETASIDNHGGRSFAGARSFRREEGGATVSVAQAQRVVCSSMKLPRECLSQARRMCSLLCCHTDREKWDMLRMSLLDERSRYRAGFSFSNGFKKKNFIAAEQRVTQFE